MLKTKKAGFVSSWVNLSNTIIGTGMLGVPFAFSVAGFAFGIISF